MRESMGIECVTGVMPTSQEQVALTELPDEVLAIGNGMRRIGNRDDKSVWNFITSNVYRKLNKF